MRTLKAPYVVSSQNVSANTTGAFTGEIAASQLADFGIKWTIIGHSERRQLFHTTDAVVAKQITLSLSSNLNIIACVGETISERKANKTWAVVQQQLDAIIAAVKPSETFASRIVVAYEPVWAIGTGETATPAQAQEVHAQIRTHLKSKLGAGIGDSTRIIYGGSVKGSNAEELFREKDIDGFLVGGAALQADDFKKIVASPTKVKSKL